MRGSWNLGQFSLSEGTTLYENLTELIENGGNLEMYELLSQYTFKITDTVRGFIPIPILC